MPTRILHVSQPCEAGVATVLLGYLDRQLSATGDDLQLSVACPAGSYLAAQVQARGIEALPWEATRRPGPSVLREVRALSDLVNFWAPDLVHLHSSKAGLAGRLVIRGQIPTVFQPHAWSFESVHGMTGVLSRLWEHRASHWAHVTVCVSQAERAAAPTPDIRARAQVIPNTVDPSRWTVGDRGAARARLGLDPSLPYAMCIGRLCAQKGQQTLVSSWPKIRDRVPDAQLVLIGDGPMARELSRSCPRGVWLVGPQDAAPWYAACDLVVVPSQWEAMAMVPLEAQAAGRMVLGYDVDGMAESLGPSNVLVPAGDRDQLAGALTTALLDLPRTHQQGIQGRLFAVLTYSPASQLNLLQTAYQDARQRHSQQT
ncbi:MAG: glycosyltransferase family 4 protein [Actinomycetota bacterium]|nr:glycosyltransferase family 4 protein [Actinomycetota bacterium]